MNIRKVGKVNLPVDPVTIDARRAGMHQYAVDHDRFGRMAIDFQRDHRPVEAEGARAYAARLYRAWQAEFMDPEVEDR